MENQRKWDLGVGPDILKAGETRKIDLQPKCLFRAEKIVAEAYDDETNSDVHLLALFVGRKEILKLDGDSIDLHGRELSIDSAPWSQPALPIEIVVTNRSGSARRVYLNIHGTAELQ